MSLSTFLPEDDAITLAEYRQAQNTEPPPEPETDEPQPLSTGQLAETLDLSRQWGSELAGRDDFPPPDDPGCGQHYGKGCRWHPRRWRLETVETWMRERA